MTELSSIMNLLCIRCLCTLFKMLINGNKYYQDARSREFVMGIYMRHLVDLFNKQYERRRK